MKARLKIEDTRRGMQSGKEMCVLSAELTLTKKEYLDLLDKSEDNYVEIEI